MSKVNFFIIGAPKCGTTALYEYLSGHPEVFLPEVKEPHYFADDLPSYRDIVTAEEYDELFANVNSHHTAIGEASVLYLFSKCALNKIYSYNPDAKIIAMVRDPVEMFQSEHAQFYYTFNEDAADPEEAWHLQKDRLKGLSIPVGCREPSILQYKELCSLGSQLEALLNIFPYDQVKIIRTRDFASSTQRVYSETLDFLKLKNDGKVIFPRVNVSKTHRLRWLGRLLLSHSASRRRSLKRLTGSADSGLKKLVVKIGYMVLRLNTKPYTRKRLRPEFEEELRRNFAVETDKIERCIEKASS